MKWTEWEEIEAIYQTAIIRIEEMFPEAFLRRLVKEAGSRSVWVMSDNSFVCKPEDQKRNRSNR